MSPDGHIVSFRRAGNGLPRPELRLFAKTLVAEVTGGKYFECLITDDRELRRLNLSFLGHDYATDVISFPSGLGGAFLGEIAISAQRAAEQAPEFGHSVADELKILMLHGVLHLLGLDHEKDRGAMAREEKRWRKRLSLPVGLIERVQA
jgi:probable rRNA maturation factor